MLWNQQAVIDALSAYDITVNDSGGDWDLMSICVWPNKDSDDAIRITPFIDPNIRQGVSDPTQDQEVYAIELKNLFADSSGGCQTENEDIERLHTEIKIILKKMGHRIIQHYSEIF